MKKNDNNSTPNKSSNLIRAKSAPSTPAQATSTSSTPLTPYSRGDRNYNSTSRNTLRSESPDHIPMNTPTSASFFNMDDFETRFSRITDNSLRIPFLFRELGLRLLYNSDNDNYYSHLRSQNFYQTDFTNKIENTDYAHKFFSNIRNNHRFLKSEIKKGAQLHETKKTISFSDGSIEVQESYKSKLYNTNYLDTLDQIVIYGNSLVYDSYKTINELIIKEFKDNNYNLIAESFKEILHGKIIDNTSLSKQQIAVIYKLFYHLFVIEGSRDPASYITIPLAFEYLSTQTGSNLFGENSNSPEIIPICFTTAMQALSYMGDVIFKDLASVQYTHSYNGTNDAMTTIRINKWNTIKAKTNDLIKKRFDGIQDHNNLDFSYILNEVLDTCDRWYGFRPRIGESNIQFFGQLGLDAKEVPRDGNCFFHALSKLLQDLQDPIESIPSELRDVAATLLGDDTIRVDGRWMGLDFHSIAQKLAWYLGVNIVLVEQNTSLDQIDTMVSNNFYYGGVNAPTIYIGNIGNMHFVLLNPNEQSSSFQQLRMAVEVHINSLVAPQQTAEIQEFQELGNEETKEDLKNIEESTIAAKSSQNDQKELETHNAQKVLQQINIVHKEDISNLIEQQQTDTNIIDQAVVENNVNEQQDTDTPLNTVGDIGAALPGINLVNNTNSQQTAVRRFQLVSEQNEIDRLNKKFPNEFKCDDRVKGNSDSEGEVGGDYSKHPGSEQDDGNAYFVTSIVYNNQEIYNDIFSSYKQNQIPNLDIGMEKSIPIFEIAPTISESLPIMVIPSELEAFSIEHLNSVLEKIYEWFSENL